MDLVRVLLPINWPHLSQFIPPLFQFGSFSQFVSSADILPGCHATYGAPYGATSSVGSDGLPAEVPIDRPFLGSVFAFLLSIWPAGVQWSPTRAWLGRKWREEVEKWIEERFTQVDSSLLYLERGSFFFVFVRTPKPQHHVFPCNNASLCEFK